MLSRIFQYVANRNNFCNPWLNTQTSFTPVKADPKVDKLRSILNLDKTNVNSDYFVTSLVALFTANHTVSHSLDLELDIQPEIWKKIQTEKFKVISSNWVLTNSKTGNASNSRFVSHWPVELVGSVIKLNDTAARVKIGGMYSDVKAVLVNNRELHVEWPDWLNINGVFVTDDNNAWANTGAEIEFFAPPKNYPIVAVVDRLKYEAAFLEVLEERGFLSYFSGADISPAEQLSIVIYCLYLDTAAKLKEHS